jgi:hypothetical protein
LTALDLGATMPRLTIVTTATGSTTMPPARPHPPPASREEYGGSPLLLLGTIAAAKLATVLVVVWLSWSSEVGALIAATTWFWVPVGTVLLSGPILYRRRLRRVRAKRAALLRSEWTAEPPAPLPVADR